MAEQHGEGSEQMSKDDELPKFRERGIGYERYETSLPGPYQQDSSTMAGYVFEADFYAVQGVIQHYLKDDPDYHYVALPFVVLTMVNIPKVYLADNPQLGDMHEIDGGYQIACIRVHRRSGSIDLSLFMPYLWVDTGTAMATGREVLGFRKDVGVSFAPPSTQVETAADLDRIEGWVTEHFGDRQKLGYLMKLEAAELGVDPRSAIPKASWQDWRNALWPLVEDSLPRLARAVSEVQSGRIGHADLKTLLLSSSLSNPNISFLKQFRDSHNGDRACYQETLSVASTVTNLTLLKLGSGEKVRIANFASHPIASELGLLRFAEPDGTYRARLSYLCSFELNVEMVSPKPDRKKVAILGGGPAGLAAMMDLSKYPEKFELTLYQMGWRLGGKCTSGRGFVSPLATEGNDPDSGESSWLRNQEHGLHMALGFYENFFDLLRQAYAAINRPETAPFRDYRDVLRPRETFTLEDHWHQWRDVPFNQLPHNDLIPGERARHAAASGGRPELLDGVLSFVELLKSLVAQTMDLFDDSPASLVHKALLKSVDLALERIPRDPAEWLQRKEEHADALRNTLCGLLTSLKDLAFERDAPTDEDASARRSLLIEHMPFWSKLSLIEFGTRFLIGLFELAPRSFRTLDHLEFTEWLKETICLPFSPWTESAVLRTCYLLPFAYQGGDTESPKLAAGAAARALLRILTDFAGAISYDFQSGMAECAIIPLYQCILRRSPDARFEFFSEVQELRTNNGQISEIVIARQATLKDPRGYQPLISVDGIDCFPTHPKYEQLVEGDDLRKGEELYPSGFDLESNWSDWAPVGKELLKLNEDFDLVILAIPPPSAKPITQALAGQSKAWKTMIDNVTGIPTIAGQLWMSETLAELGWTTERSNGPPLILAYEEPHPAIADMSDVVAHEPWKSSEPAPKSTFYICGAAPFPPKLPNMSGGDYLREARDWAKGETLSWVRKALPYLFPNMEDDGDITWNTFACPLAGRSGEGRFLSQYWRLNVSLSELYITTFPNNPALRLPSKAPDFHNLLLAGDWTDNNIHIGSLEGAVLSGRMAARQALGLDYWLYGERDPWPWDS